MTIGQRILQIRNSCALSQEAFGEKLGVTRQTVSKWELDQALPDLSKIVLISKIFSVTTDSLLIGGITSFEDLTAEPPYGVYRSDTCELVETALFALILEGSADKNILTARLYMGFDQEKHLRGICEHDKTCKQTRYAYTTDTGEIYTNDAEKIALRLGEKYDHQKKTAMYKTEALIMDHSCAPLPKVSEAGIANCLLAWRMGDSFRADAKRFFFFLCTGKTEYVFQIFPEKTNIYCGASYNRVFELGLFGAKQFFRIRNLEDNRQPYCTFFCDFSYQPQEIRIPTEKCELQKCISTESGYLWCLKRYTDDKIVLQGCGDDEYVYNRNAKHTERFCL